MPTIVLWSWELAPELSPKKAKDLFREVLKCDPCSYCGTRDEKPVIDHIEPMAAWGDDIWENLTASCRACNSAKRSGSLLGFLASVDVGWGKFEGYGARDLREMNARSQRAACVTARLVA